MIFQEAYVKDVHECSLKKAWFQDVYECLFVGRCHCLAYHSVWPSCSSRVGIMLSSPSQ